jgi:hypothetical protein
LTAGRSSFSARIVRSSILVFLFQPGVYPLRQKGARRSMAGVFGKKWVTNSPTMLGADPQMTDAHCVPGASAGTLPRMPSRVSGAAVAFVVALPRGRGGGHSEVISRSERFIKPFDIKHPKWGVVIQNGVVFVCLAAPFQADDEVTRSTPFSNFLNISNLL